MKLAAEANLERMSIMQLEMDKSEVKNFDQPDEVRIFPKGKLELVKVGHKIIGRAILNPGWRWSTSVKPIAETESCLAPHFQYLVSGVLKVRMDNGEEFELRAGDISLLASGHDSWVVGDEPVVLVDFQGMLDYAKKKH
jgi:hypothetical protein